MEDSGYELFELKDRGGAVTAYHFPCENPTHVVCLIHGIGEYAGRFRRVTEAMGRAGIAVVSMDLRGHGRSEGARGHCAPRQEVLKDMDALMETVQEFYPSLPLILYGHSMGGNLTLDYRCRGTYNDLPAAYVITSPWLRLVHPIPRPIYHTVKALAHVAPTMTFRAAARPEDLGNPAYVLPYLQDPLVHPRVSMLCACDGYLTGQALETGTLEDNGRAGQIPCLLLHGTLDKICDIEGSRRFAARQNPDFFTFEEIPGGYHELHNGTPEGKTGDEIIQHIIEYIKTIPVERGTKG